MQFGIFSVGDVTPDPTTGRTPTERERIKAMVAIARSAESGKPVALADELAGRPYVKSHHNAALRERIGRTAGSVERKHMNISAVLTELGLPTINLSETPLEGWSRFVKRGFDLAVAAALAQGRPIAIDVAIDYTRKTYFTKGVVKTNLRRLPFADQLRFIGRAIGRRLVPSR